MVAESAISPDCLFSMTYRAFRFAIFRGLFVFSGLAPLSRFAAAVFLSLTTKAPPWARSREARTGFVMASGKQ
jgi:hypothetical protein